MTEVEAGLRRLLLGAFAAGDLGVAAELVLAGHTESPVQAVPFDLAAAGLAAAAWVWTSSNATSRRALRAVALAHAVGGLFGTWEHVEHNLEFELEIRPAEPWTTSAAAAAFGANPALAPGVFVLFAALAAGSVWRDER
jgi:hypothetical protein